MSVEFPTKTLYLCGPITGLDYNGATDWRNRVSANLPWHIMALSPMRGKEFLKTAGIISGAPEMYPGTALASPKGIITRDANDIRSCDAVLANFLGANRVSIGSCHEFGMAYAMRKPLILVMEKDGTNPHHHAFITETAGYWVETMDEAVNIATLLLTPGV